MGFKTITIKEDVYDKLLRAKGKDVSFSEFFEKTIKEKKGAPDIVKFYGSWKMSDEEWKRVRERMKNFRRSADKDYKEKMKRLFG